MPIHFPNRSDGSGPGLVVYLTCGDPSINVTRDIALAAIDAGADVIELGVPFSDPVGDGPVIQRASGRAVENGTTLDQVLKLAGVLRRSRPESGLIVFSYFNPILRFGLERFAHEARSAGVDGALVIDLTIEESDAYLALMAEQRLATVFLAAPTSPDARLKKIARQSSGFVYAVSRTGVTGAQEQLSEDAKELVSRLRKLTSLPIALGFGVSTSAHFREIGNFADAAVVGSAIVKIVEEYGNRSPAHVARFIAELTGRRVADMLRRPAP